MALYKGVVRARIIEVRFAQSGKIANVLKRTGDHVEKNELIASLDRKILQTQLDRELADFEKARAEFDMFTQKNQSAGDLGITYERTIRQAQLNASIKNVELAKANLDQTNLYSPVTGTILDDGCMEVGLNITPASATLLVVDGLSYNFEIEIEQDKIPFFENPKEAKIEIVGIKHEITGVSGKIIATGKRFFITIPITDTTGIFLGQYGQAQFKS